MTRPRAADDHAWGLGSLTGWRTAFIGNSGVSRKDSVGEPDFANPVNASDSSGELRGLPGLIERVRRRMLARRLVFDSMIWLNWSLLTLIVTAAFSRKLEYALIAAAAVASVGAILSLAREWWMRPSAYYCARETDRASGLYDRLSTALYFASKQSRAGMPDAMPDAMIVHQRRDAISRVEGVDPRALFPVGLPEFVNRTVVLAVIAFALLGYRLYYNPPMAALLRGVVGSHVEKTLLSPLAGAVKKELLALVDRDETQVKEASPDAETVPGLADPKTADDASQPGDKDGASPGDSQDDSQATAGAEGDTGDPQQGNQPNAQGQDANQPGNASQNPQMADPNQQQSGQNGQNGENSSSAQPQTGGQQSSGSSVMQALKNLMKNMTGQPNPSDSNGQSSSAGSSQQPGSSSGQGEAKNDSPKDGNEQKETGSSSSSQKPGGGAGNGSTPVPKQAAKDTTPPPKNLPQDRVNLEANNFRQQGRVRTTSAAGTAQVPLRDIKPQPVAAIKGSEQENIPVRYRLYVQRYFEHTDKASQ
jgi:hypothetical protein